MSELNISSPETTGALVVINRILQELVALEGTIVSHLVITASKETIQECGTAQCRFSIHRKREPKTWRNQAQEQNNLEHQMSSRLIYEEGPSASHVP